jgi:cyanate permease
VKAERKMSPWIVFTLVLCLNIAAMFCIASMPPLFAEIRTEIELSGAQMGSLMGVFVLAALIFAPIGGILSDRIGSRWAIGIGMLLAAVAGGLRAIADTPFGLIAGMFAVGAGFNMAAPSIPKIFGIWFPPGRLAFVNGINMAGVGSGAAGATAMAASILSPLFGGWRGVMVAMGGFLFMAGILWIVVYRDPADERPTPGKRPRMFDGFKQVARIKDMRLLGGFFGLMSLGFMPVVAFLPISLTGRGIAHAGELAAIIAAVAVIFNIVGGRISDMIGQRKPIMIFGTITAGLCVLTYSSLSGIPLIIMLIITGASVGSMAPIIFTIPIEMRSVRPEFAATAVGFMMMCQSWSGFLGPIIAGKLIDSTESYLVGFIFMGSAIFLAALFAIPMKETGRKGEEDSSDFNV